MLLIPNVPCKYVADFPTEIEFILLHKLMDNECYRNYYIENKNNNKYKILDNSAFELGEGLDSELLLEWAEKINATEIIIPDVYSDKNKTLNLMFDFLEKYPNCKYNLMVVPQGKDLKELEECNDIMKMIDNVYCIGLNKLWDRYDLDRVSASNMVYYKKENHMLGVRDLSDWFSVDKMHIRSADSRILTKIITDNEDIWEDELSKDQYKSLKNLINEVQKW